MDVVKTILDTLPIEMWGHQIFPGGIFMNVVWAISPIIILKAYLKYQYSMSKIQKILLGWLFITFLPNTLYLAFEIKHLIKMDNVADDLTILAVIVFSGLSLLGIILTTYTVIKTVNNVKPISLLPDLSIIMLSCVTSIGAVIGLEEATSFMGFLFPPIIFVYLYKVFTTPNLLLIFLVSWFVISKWIILTWEFLYKESYYFEESPQ
jgi:hypothetical protein